MHQKERIKLIEDILKKNGFVTVKFLTEELHYSTATINRDLNVMQKQKLIKRSYGGAEPVKSKAVPFIFRYNKMRPAKNKIAKKAAELICDGDTVFIDASTTSQYIGKYITDRKNLRVITNNLSLAAFLSEYNIEVICLGGKISDPPSVICSAETAEYAQRYHADKMFFSAAVVTSDGKISGGGIYSLIINMMIDNSSESYFLIDHEKVDRPCGEYRGTLSDVSGVISDFGFSDEVKNKYKTVNFIEV